MRRSPGRIALILRILPISYGFQAVAVLSNSSFNALHEPRNAVAAECAALVRVLRAAVAGTGAQLFGFEGLFAGAALGNVCGGLVAAMVDSSLQQRRWRRVAYTARA